MSDHEADEHRDALLAGLTTEHPVDMANTVPGEVIVLKEPQGNRFVYPKWMPSPTGIAVSWGAAFAFGAYAVVKGSDRPGLSRRMTLLAAWCSAHYVRERNEWRLQHLVRRAYEAPQDTPEKAFWRRVGSLTHDGWGASAFAWRATARNAIADMVANQPAEYEQAARSLANIEHSATTKGDWRYTLNNLYSLLLTSSRESRAFWMLKWLNELEPDEGDSPQILDNAVRQASYMSMIENWENWEVIYIVSTVGVCVSAVTGELARRRPVLRFSLAMGVCSIAASWTYPLALQHLLETPSRLSRRDWLERLTFFLHLSAYIQSSVAGSTSSKF